MARPQKNGVDYFPLDVDLMQDKKVRLITAEFGTDGIAVLLHLLCEIYRNGYYKKWDADDALFTTSFMGGKCAEQAVTKIVRACVKRGIFNPVLYRKHSILTSAGVQRRYLRAVSMRDEIRIYEDYFLLDADNKRDVPPYIRAKITFTRLPQRRRSSYSEGKALTDVLFALPKGGGV